jgi:signal-transduction protein with cAMP-binding, CBS, and nucleotidyltransferase domain
MGLRRLRSANIWPGFWRRARPGWRRWQRGTAVLQVGLTLFGGFADDEEYPAPASRTDLKLHGLMPLVAASPAFGFARWRHRNRDISAHCGPGRAGSIAARERATCKAAFALLLDVVLRQQLADHAADRRPGQSGGYGGHCPRKRGRHCGRL